MTALSSVHSLTLVNKKDYDKWQEGRLLYHYLYSRLVTKEQAIEIMKGHTWYQENLDFSDHEAVQEALSEGYWTCGQYNDYVSTRNFDSFADEFDTPNGDTVIAFGYYGFAG